MAEKFRILRRRKIVNKCVLCGRPIPSNKIICDVCSRKNIFRRMSK